MTGGRPRLVVVGGGISGLAAAWSLAQQSGAEVILLEAADRLGGRIETETFAGCPVDTGADAFITRTAAAEQLCRDLGLGDELEAPATAEASILAGGSLRPIPKGLVMGVPTDFAQLLRARLLTPGGMARAAADLVLPRRQGTCDDPSVAQALAPRLGRQVVERLVEPLVGGINAGQADRLSLASTAPQLAAMIGGHRSVILALRKGRSALASDGAAGEAAAGIPRPLFLGLRRGLESLVGALAEAIAGRGATIRLGMRVESLERAGDRYVLSVKPVSGAAERLEADAVIIATPSYEAARMLEHLVPAAAAELAAIHYASVALVMLSWPVTALPYRPAGSPASGPHRAGGQVLPGSGFLVPRTGRYLITAATFTSSKWPRSSVPGRVVIRASTGHYGDDRHERLTDAELVARVREELASILGITGPPLAHLVRRHPRSFPQYEPGHRARVERIRKALSGLPGLCVAGAAYDGIGIPSCILSGQQAAGSVTAAPVGTGPGR